MSQKQDFWAGVEYASPEYYRLWRAKNAEKSRAYHREYDRRMYKKYPEREQARRRRYEIKHPHKIKAHKLLNYAIRTGKMCKYPCVACQSTVVVAHHDNYDKPLTVVWLCELHHKERHRMLLTQLQ